VAVAELDERGRGLDRVLNFSDAVFAIAITLLVLNLKVPHLTGRDVNHRLLDALGHDSGLLAGFVISFYVIARYWMSHHRLSILLRRVDTPFIVLNLVFLAFIVFVPFPTEVLGVYGGTTTAVVFYAGTMVPTGLLSWATWEYALRKGLDDGRAPAGTRRQAKLRNGYLVIVFAISIPVAFADPGAAQVMWALLVLQYRFASRFSGAGRPTAAPRRTRG
jgi:TMEM175 potassium channel family protein